MKERINLVASILGIVGFIGTLVSWASDNRTALIFSFVLVVASLLFIIVVAILRSRQRTVGMEKILEGDLWISSNRHNRLCVDSSFLSLDEGTILFWILIPSNDEGLRNAPHNRYLFSHQTGESDNLRHLNAFFLRYSSENTWDFFFSNPNGEMPNDLDKYRIKDGLSDGWHHVQVSWDHSKPILRLLFNAGSSISIRSKNYLTYWPRELDDCVYFGAWVSNYPESYIETKLRHLWISDKYLDAKHPQVVLHRSIGQL